MVFLQGSKSWCLFYYILYNVIFQRYNKLSMHYMKCTINFHFAFVDHVTIYLLVFSHLKTFLRREDKQLIVHKLHASVYNFFLHLSFQRMLSKHNRFAIILQNEKYFSFIQCSQLSKNFCDYFNYMVIKLNAFKKFNDIISFSSEFIETKAIEHHYMYLFTHLRNAKEM